jgi:hypothetical protein
MDRSQLQSFYQQGYRTLYQETEEPTKKDLVMQEERARETLQMIREDVDHVYRHLDIGSSSGAFLQATRNTYDCEIIGIEPGDLYRQFSQARGIEVYASLDELPETHRSFDLVSMMHVLEHLDNPVTTLSRLRMELMNSNDYLLLEVPNLLEHEALEMAHLFAFTQGTLCETVRRSGFEVIWSKAHGGFRSPIIKLYITLLARVPDNTARQLPIHARHRAIAIRRRFGKYKRAFFTRLLPDWTWQSPPVLWEESEPPMDG